MKYILVILFSLFFTKVESKPIHLSGSLPEFAGKKLIIQYLDHFKGEIPVNMNGKFSANITLSSGYYALKDANITVYLEPGMSLSISKINQQVVFSGKGSVENKIATHVTELAASYLPLKDEMLTNEINFTEPDSFQNMLSRYRSAVFKLINNANVSIYFKHSQTKKVNYFCQLLSSEYLTQYGVDAAKRQAANGLLRDYLFAARKSGKADSVIYKKYKQTMKASQIKVMTASDSLKFNVFNHFDMNDELAYRSSADYRWLVQQNYISLENQLHAEDQSLSGRGISDKIIADHITNPFIKQEMEFQYVLDRFNLKIDIDKSYEEYIASATNKAYINDVRKIYLEIRKNPAILAAAAEGTKIGRTAIDFTQYTPKNKPVKLSDFKGKYVLIDFWASWCTPCRAENPAVVAAYNKYKSKNFTVLGISLDNPGGRDAWLNAIQKDKLTWTQVSDLKGFNNMAALKYGVTSIPTNFLIDPDGKIIARDLHGDALNKKLDELLANVSK